MSDYNAELGDDFDEFRTTTGLKDDYDGTVVDAFFGKPQIGGERMMLFAKVAADDGDEVELRWSVGNGWASYDGGRTVEHPTEHHFNNRSAYGTMFSTAIRLPGCKDELGRRSQEELDRRGPKDARLWVGLKFHWNVIVEQMDLPERDALGQPVVENGRPKMTHVEVPRTMPTAFLGVGDSAKSTPAKAARTTKKAASTTTAAAPAEKEETATAGNGDRGAALAGDPALLKKLSVGAKTKTFADWVDWAMDQPGVLDDDEIVARLGNDQFYAQLKA